MIKDLPQKRKAIKYCVANGLIPFLEVAVSYEGDTGPAKHEITDVDVLAVRPADAAPLKRIIFDCKTVKTSPINRALWAKGLAAFISADEAFVILSKPAPDAHRLAGGVIGVRLFSEEIFDVYALAANSNYGVSNSYIERLDAWEILRRIGDKYPLIRNHIAQLQSAGPLISDPAAGIRALVACIRKIEGELDPEKKEHVALFILSCMQLLLFFSELVRIFHNVFDPGVGKERFESTLRHYIWGGRENYEIRQRLKAAVAQRRGGESAQFDLPGWQEFIEVFRSLLDAPTLVGTCCLPLLDLGFRNLSVPEKELDARLRERLSANGRIRQFINLAASYLLAASKLPREFRIETNKLVADICNGGESEPKPGPTSTGTRDATES